MQSKRGRMRDVNRRFSTKGIASLFNKLEATGDFYYPAMRAIMTTSDHVTGGQPQGGAIEMSDQWLFKSETYDNCNCAVNCGCQFNLPTTHGHCQSAFVGKIIEGHFNDTPLAGLNWAALYRWPGEIKDGQGRRQIVIDQRAKEAQRIALQTIISGEAGAPLSNLFSVFASTCSQLYDTLFLPIDLEADLEERTAKVDIPGIMKSRGKPIINEFTGEPFHIALARRRGSFEFTYAEVGMGTTSVTGAVEMAHEDSWAHYCIHHFNQDGLVRQGSRLTAWLAGMSARSRD